MTLRTAGSLLVVVALSACDVDPGIETVADAGVAPPDAGVHEPVAAPCAPQNGAAVSCVDFEVPLSDFDDLELGCFARSSARMVNRCDQTVVVTQIQFGATTPDLFLTQAPAVPSCGLELRPGEGFIVGVGYRPRTAAAVAGALSVEVATPDGSEARAWNVDARGAPMTTATEEHVISDPQRPVDVLVVIDNGPSLSNDLESLRQNLRLFAKYAQASALDANVSVALVADTATAKRGDLLEGPSGAPVFHSNAGTFVTDFGNAVDTITIGPSAHDAYEVASIGLQQLADAALLRPGATRTLVFISDWHEQSPRTVGEYRADYLQLTSAPRYDLAVNAVAGFSTSASCSGMPDDGRYRALAELTNGVREDICVPDWAKTLEHLAKLALGFRVNILLAGAPDLSRGPLRVFIGAEEIPSVDERGATVWTFDSAANALRFEPAYAPEPGQTVRVTYPLPCPSAD